MASNGLKDDPKILLGHLFHIFYFIRIDQPNKILCSPPMFLPSSLPFFGCLTLDKVFDIFKCHLSGPYVLDFPGSFLCKAICQFLSFIARVTFNPSGIKWTGLLDFCNQVQNQLHRRTPDFWGLLYQFHGLRVRVDDNSAFYPLWVWYQPIESCP